MAKLEAEQKATEAAAALLSSPKPTVDVTAPTTTTTTPQTPTQTGGDTKTAPSGPVGGACDKYEGHKFKKDTCAKCFKPLKDHAQPAPTTPKSGPGGGSKACGKYIAHKFKKDTCATCFQPKTQHSA